MNHIYRSIWNESTGTVVAVSEHAKRGGKKTSRGRNAVVSSGFILKSLASIVALTSASASYASPTGGTVVAGNASITTAPGNTTINQTTQNVSINWQTFDIGVGEAVKFVQPNSSAVALNRVLGADPSRILGNLSANGKVFLVNPNGVLFGTGAQVNVGGLVASTRNITDSDFMAGRYAFSGTSNGSVVNQGSINADGGYVALLGANVSNQGVIAARLGTVALAAGDALTLDVAGDGLLNVAVNTGSVNALVQNGGLIQANGGQVLLTAQSAGTLLQSAVNNTGMIQAQTISNHNGVIKLLGDMRNGAVNVGGTLDASAPDGGNGGFVDTSAAHVRVGSDAKITTAAARGLTGSWLIDPTDYTIAASGGDISGAALSSNLANTDITILSTSGGSGTLGSINVNDTVDWSANKLTLNAQNDININTAMNASGSASLALLYGQGAVAAGNTSTVNVNAPVNLPAGNNFSTRQGSDGSTVNYTVITSLGAPGSTTATDLQGMNGNMAGNYVLGASIDASTTSGWNAGAGFSPVVASEQVTESGEGEPYTYTRFLPFTGTFDGLGHTINGLTINQPTTSNAGLFGLIGQASTVRNVGLVGGAVTGSTYTGMLAGRNDGSISNSYATAVVTSSQDGARYVGGLVGRNTGAITNSYATGAVTSDQDNNLFTGGLVGSNAGAISNSYATGAVNGRRSVGGLAGENVSTGSISRSHATGAVTAGTYNSGGLVGSNDAGGTVSESYATGSVSGGKNVSGGLVGQNYGSVSTSYATGSVMNSEDYVGGLVGINGYTTGTIALSYSQGAVSGGDIYVGGLVGRNLGQAITSSYWDTDTSGQAGSAGGTGLTTVQMRTAANFAGFNFTTTLGASSNNWVMVDANGTLNNAGGAVGATRPMLASEYSTTINNAHQLQLMAMDLAGSYSLGRDIDAAATGTTGDVWSAASFISVGDYFSRFTGVFDGRRHTIDGLNINQHGADRVGLFGDIGSAGSVQNVGITGASITGSLIAGTLAGANNGTIRNSYATATVAGAVGIGGLVGQNYGTISGSYAEAVVTGPSGAGGLVGAQHTGGLISDSYAIGTVSGSNYVGGLVGINDGGTINRSYAAAAVSGSSYVGGLVGKNYIGSTSNSYWNSDVMASGFGAGSNGTMINVVGVSGAGMKQHANFSSLDFNNTWVMFDTVSTPLLRALMTSLSVTVSDASKIYDGTAYSGGNGVSYSVIPGAGLLGSLSFSGSSQGAVNAGSYDIKASGLYSTSQQGYLITYVDGALSVGRADLAVSTTNVSKTYDGGLSAAGTATVSSGTLFGSDTLSGGTFAFTDKDVGAGNKAVTMSGITVNDGNSGGNYNLSYVDNTTSTISKADLTLSTGNVNKTYDGNLSAIGTATVNSGALFGDDTLSGGTFAFTDKNVGAGNKTVTVGGINVNDGNDGGNYNVSYVDNTSSTITPKALTVVGETASNKVYDGTTTATLAGGALADVVAGDEVTLVEAGTFATPDISTGIEVMAANSLGGASAANYTVTQPAGLTANITAPAVVTPPDTTPPSEAVPPAVKNAIASAVWVTVPPAFRNDTPDLSASPASHDSSAPSSPAGAAASNQNPAGSNWGALSGLNLTIIGTGVTMAPGAQINGATDGAK